VTGIEEVLALWRELERVHEGLPDGDPERDAIALEISRVRDLYRRLTHHSEHTASLLQASRRTIERAHATIRAAERRLSPGDTASLGLSPNDGRETRV